MTTTITSAEVQRKHELAERLGERMSEFKLTYNPTATVAVDASADESDPDTEGFCFLLEDCAGGEFPALGFEAWIDGRDNAGDLAQSVVNELQSIADGYQAVAKRIADRLNRVPKPSKYQWADLPPHHEDASEIMPRPEFKDRAGSMKTNDPGRVREVLPNGDVVVDGADLYRVTRGSEVILELATLSEAQSCAWIFNLSSSREQAQAISYAELARSKS